jgi:hypothetical protein
LRIYLHIYDRLTLKGGKTISFILQYLYNKWTIIIDGKQTCIANGPIRLYPSQEKDSLHFSAQFPGWGDEEGQTTILQLYQLLSENQNEVLKLEYDWQMAVPVESIGFTKDSSQPTSYSDSETATNVNLVSEPQPTIIVNAQTYQTKTVTTPTKKTISENSTMWADDLSTDGFGTTLNDTDEKACKDFYKIFEVCKLYVFLIVLEFNTRRL